MSQYLGVKHHHPLLEKRHFEALKQTHTPPTGALRRLEFLDKLMRAMGGVPFKAPTLAWFDTTGKFQSQDLGESLVLGRGSQCSLVLEGAMVSRTHCKITRVEQLHVIEDLGSSNGTLLNGRRLSNGESAALRRGDVITIGERELAVVGGAG